ncbi:MAG: hypothetical protein QOI91_2517 [Solirubrobacteraceae bacterium]|jgi:hypothetical protein|nr:hypothetical protein [Solirubrobacteraceae bacterium]
MVESALAAAALALVYLIVAPYSADLAAQVYRTNLFREAGFTVWNGQWFGGHHTPGYSVLFPPLASIAGPRLVGALSAVASAVLFERLATARWGSQARVGAIWFGLATATNLFTGRLTFGLGVALGLGALLAVQRGRAVPAAALAILTSLGSPVAGLLLAMAGVADGLANRRRLSLVVAAAAFGAAGALAVAFPEGGHQPFPMSTFWPTVLVAVPFVLFVPRENRALRWGAVLYALSCTASMYIDTPMGANVTRVGTQFAGPLLACVLWPHRRKLLAVLALPLLYWQWMAPYRDVNKAIDDPSVEASFHAPLNAYLRSVHPTGRIEIPSLKNHWETVHVAPHFQLARGWERQLDIKYNDVFYIHEPILYAADYRAWLRSTGVEYVAVAYAPLDHAAEGEAKLIAHGLPYLQPVWSNRNWHVYRFRDAAPMATGGARVVELGPTSFTLRADAAGVTDVRVRYTPYWQLESGSGCVQEGPGGFTRVRLKRPGTVRVATDFSLLRVVDRGPRCR